MVIASLDFKVDPKLPDSFLQDLEGDADSMEMFEADPYLPSTALGTNKSAPEEVFCTTGAVQSSQL